MDEPESPIKRNSTKMVLRLRCYNIVDVGGFSLTDPFIVLYSRGYRQKQWQVVGHTELIWNNLNPAFNTPFVLDYDFSEQLFLKFELYHGQQEENPMHKAKFLGEAKCTMGEIVGNKCQLSKFFSSQKSRGNKGLLMLCLEEYSDNTETIQFQLSAQGLKKVSGAFHKLRPMFQLLKVVGDTSKAPVLTSEPAKGTACQWPLCEIGKNFLCNNDEDLPLTLEVHHYSKHNANKLIGMTQLSYRDLFEDGRTKFMLRKEVGSTKSRGEVMFSEVSRTMKHSFLDYIRGGCEVNLVVAIDFTKSNLDPADPNSLHAIRGDNFNPYEQALYSVGEILLNYDSDQFVPMYGFGGKVDGLINHCFPVNGCREDPNVKGLNHMLVEYRRALSRVELAGPTLYHLVIQKVVLEAEIAQRSGSQQYFVLLILTDGSFDDRVETIDWIVRGSKTPLSIVIVGIGDVTNLAVLESIDNETLVNTRGEPMARDIVKFVHYDRVAHSQDKLRNEVLKEIPGALVEYFTVLNNIPPNIPRSFSQYNPEEEIGRGPTINPNTFTITPAMIQAQVEGNWIPERESVSTEGDLAYPSLSGEFNSIPPPRASENPYDQFAGGPQRYVTQVIGRKQTHS